jgi:hypothetical protein
MNRFVQLFFSVRLTVALLVLGLLLVFVGTLAQVEQGLYQAQARYFKSFFVYWSPGGGSLSIPVFPGGYLVGTLMIVNLVAVGSRRLRPARGKWGLLMIHAGLVMLLLGQLITDLLSVESAMRLSEGETKNYSEDFHNNELAVIDTTDPEHEQVVSIPERLVRRGGELAVPSTPFTLGISEYWVNAELLTREVAGAKPSTADRDVGDGLWIQGRPPTARMDERNLPAALVEIRAGSERLGTWLVSSRIAQPQVFEHAGRSWKIELRPQRHYTPFSLTLIECRHEVYPGTEIPKNFSSRVTVSSPASGEEREVLIWMNNPLRYGGNTYYQYQMAAASRSSTLQVVRNPGWLTPYVACTLVGVGLLWQFMSHLIAFLKTRRRHAS